MQKHTGIHRSTARSLKNFVNAQNFRHMPAYGSQVVGKLSDRSHITCQLVISRKTFR